MTKLPYREKRRVTHWHSYLHGLGLLPIVALIALLSPFIPAPLDNIRWHGAQTIFVEVGAVFLLAALLCRPWSSLQVFKLDRHHLPFVFLHLLLLWGLISCFRSPTSFAVQGLLQLSLVVLMTNVVAAHSTDTRKVLFLMISLLLTASLVALTGLTQLGEGKLPLAVGVLYDHQLFGAFLLLPIPLCLALSVAPGTLTRRLVGQGALLICFAGIWESQNRSAWLGTLVSLGAFVGLWCHAAFRGSIPANRSGNWKDAFVPLLLGMVALVGFMFISPNQDRLFARMQATDPVMHGSDEALRWRKIVWVGTRRMIAEKPLVGWGIGSFPLQHESFTHTGHPAAVVLHQGPSIEDEAHNSYLQVWAELGVVGLLLWLGAFFSLIAGGIQSVNLQKSGSLEQWLLIGGVSAIAGQMTDALANPAWQFSHISLPLWIIFGIIAALSIPLEAKQVHYPLPFRAWPWRIAQAAFAIGLGFWFLEIIWQTAFALPSPHL